MIVLTAALLLATGAPDDQWNSEKVRRVGAAFGDCVVKRRTREAQAFVLYDPISDRDEDRRQTRLIQRVADSGCLLEAAQSMGGVEMHFPGDTMRYVLADALFRSELMNKPPLEDVSQLALLQHPKFNASKYQAEAGKILKPKEAAELAENRDKELSRIVFSRFGECVVRMDPKSAEQLLRTAVLSPEEDKAFAALKDALSVCVPENATVSLNKMTVRGTVAYNYYRLARAPRVAAASTGASE